MRFFWNEKPSKVAYKYTGAKICGMLEVFSALSSKLPNIPRNAEAARIDKRRAAQVLLMLHR